MKIFLMTKYRTTIPADYSNGRFIEGYLEVKNKKEENKIIKLFHENRKIELFENIEKYINNNFSDKKTIIKFSDDEFFKTTAGFKTKKGQNLEDYQYFFWIENEYGVTLIIDNE